MLTHTKTLADHLKTAGDPNRLAIIRILGGEDRICVSDIAKRLKMSVAAVSHHMRALARDKLVIPERHGKRICYVFTKDTFVRDLIKLINKYTK